MFSFSVCTPKAEANRQLISGEKENSQFLHWTSTKQSHFSHNGFLIKTSKGTRSSATAKLTNRKYQTQPQTVLQIFLHVHIEANE